MFVWAVVTRINPNDARLVGAFYNVDDANAAAGPQDQIFNFEIGGGLGDPIWMIVTRPNPSTMAFFGWTSSWLDATFQFNSATLTGQKPVLLYFNIQDDPVGIGVWFVTITGTGQGGAPREIGHFTNLTDAQEAATLAQNEFGGTAHIFSWILPPPLLIEPLPGTGRIPVDTAVRAVLEQFFVERWRRDFLSTLPEAAAVFDPGHGVQQVCPMFWSDRSFDPDDPNDPLLAEIPPALLRDAGFPDDPDYLAGTGFIVVVIQQRASRERSRGSSAPRSVNYDLLVHIATAPDTSWYQAETYKDAIEVVLSEILLNPLGRAVNSRLECLRYLRVEQAAPTRRTVITDSWQWLIFPITLTASIRHPGTLGSIDVDVP